MSVHRDMTEFVQYTKQGGNPAGGYLIRLERFKEGLQLGQKIAPTIFF